MSKNQAPNKPLTEAQYLAIFLAKPDYMKEVSVVHGTSVVIEMNSEHQAKMLKKALDTALAEAAAYAQAAS